MKNKIKIISFIFVSLLFVKLHSQEALKSVEEEYYDFLSLQGIVECPTLGYRTLSDNIWQVSNYCDHDWKNNNLGNFFTLWEAQNPSKNFFTKGINQGLFLRIYGPYWFNSYNTKTPYGQNDGALWQGRGYNTSLSTGFRLEGYGFELTFKPQFVFSQNLDFEYLLGQYGDSHSYFEIGNIDLVQRYGENPFWNFDWGDSEIRWTWNTFTLGFGNQNPWLGPAILNPMLGSNNAPSYTKIDVGIRKTKIIIPGINWYIGDIEGRIWLGRLTESNYFDNNDNNNYRMLNALSASFSPTFIPGLTVGINRIFVTYWKTENLKYILRLFTTTHSNALASSGNDEDQKFSLFAQWLFPKIGFMVYGEFGRDDFSSNEKTNPFHTAIYTVGAKQNIPLPFNLKSELLFEWNNFEMSQDFQLQWQYMGYYAHGFVKQGYTNKGQIIGSGSGYFGNSQFIQYKVYYPKGYTGLSFHRYCPNNNYIYNKAINDSANNSNSSLHNDWYANYETYFVWTIESQYYIFSDFSVNGSFSYIQIINSLYKQKNKINNFNITLGAKYNF